MYTQGAWDFPLSRGDIVHRILQLSETEVDLANRAVGELETENANLRAAQHEPLKVTVERRPSVTRGSIAAVRWCSADSSSSVQFVTRGNESCDSGDDQHEFRLRPREYVQMVRGRIDRGTIGRSNLSSTRTCASWLSIVTSDLRMKTLGRPSATSLLPTFTFVAEEGKEIIGLTLDEDGLTAGISQAELRCDQLLSPLA
mmetsp:Transcript_25622/g.41087  ORF Transcript_25622/g.41087 Transcript_25622/m.41087 type:complete len:200 (+) Transcript_25622:74-673(+)